ncbi:STAS domain-containing protein [Thiomicrorhabdus sp.]|uniref:STAS domain-containing protein n=1 Tax=Thiomicrorhabdus sp. TaxID=2039724 RepID=UPI002AA6D5CC|nr:STAS domain-containing protein [Thiomicrorhabdus sp.]
MSNVIQLPESLTIHHIESHFNELNKKFNDFDDDITIEASAVENVDTSGLQTLMILVKNAIDNGKTVTWLEVPEILKLSAEKLGLKQQLSF